MERDDPTTAKSTNVERRILLSQLIMDDHELSPLELRVLGYRFGLEDGIPRSLAWIAEKLDQPLEVLEKLLERSCRELSLPENLRLPDEPAS